MEKNEEEEDDDNYHGFPKYDGTTMGEENEEQEAEEEASHEPADDLGRAIANGKRKCESEREKLKFDRVLEKKEKGLYPNCEDGNTKLGTALELLQRKAENGILDK